MLRRRKHPKMGLRSGEGPIRCAAHLQFVRGFNCLVADERCSDVTQAAHIRLGTDGGMGRKPSDCYVVPLCTVHHDEQHRIGEATFAFKYRLDLERMAEILWRTSKPAQRWRRERERAEA